MIFTYVWALDDPDDTAHIDRVVQVFECRNAQICFVELEATQVERLRRNGTPLRLAEKKTRRDIENSRAHLIDVDLRVWPLDRSKRTQWSEERL